MKSKAGEGSLFSFEQYERLAETLTMLANQYASKAILDLVRRLEASSAGEPPAQVRASDHT